MKATTTILLLLYSLCVHSQEPTGEETQRWIAEKIAAYGHGSNRYKVGFGAPDGVVTTPAEMWFQASSWHSFTGEVVCLGQVDVREIAYISFTNYSDAVWLNLVLKSSHPNSWDDCDKIESNGRCSFILRRQFNDDGLPDRIKRAFSRLVELQGGKLATEEPY